MIENLLPVYLLIGISVKVNSLPVWKLKEIGNADSHPVSYLIENPVNSSEFISGQVPVFPNELH